MSNTHLLNPNPSIRETPHNKFENLTLDDIEFYERITEQITSSHALPFEIPVDSFYRILMKCMKFFWKWHPEATIETSYLMPYNEIVKFKKGTGYQIPLPYNIENVFGWKLVHQAYNSALGNFLRWNLIQTYSTNTGMGMNGGSFRMGYKNGTQSMSNLVMQLYEFESYNEMFGRVISGNFNNAKSVLTLRSNVDSSMVIDVFERLLPEDLYNTYDFEDYVIACVEEQLGRIVTAFDFPLIGDVKINYDQIRERGIEKKTKIEEEIKEISGNHDFILFKR